MPPQRRQLATILPVQSRSLYPRLARLYNGHRRPPVALFLLGTAMQVRCPHCQNPIGLAEVAFSERGRLPQPSVSLSSRSPICPISTRQPKFRSNDFTYWPTLFRESA